MRTVINDNDELNKVINKEAWERAKLIRQAEREAEKNEADGWFCCFLVLYIIFIFWFFSG